MDEKKYNVEEELHFQPLEYSAESSGSELVGISVEGSGLNGVIVGNDENLPGAGNEEEKVLSKSALRMRQYRSKKHK